jgi:integrase
MALTASDVQKGLTSLAARSSTRTVQIAHNVLVRAIRHAERDDLVGRNVAALVDTPKGQQEGRPSKSLTLEQTAALMAAAEGTALEAYVIVSLLSGVRTEEARALRWDHVVTWVDEQWQPVGEARFDHDQVAVFVWRAERAGGDTKTPRSRRTLALPRKCVEALREHRVQQAKDRLSAGPLWKDHGLVFASAVGTPLDVHNVRRQFRVITEAAGLGKAWVPRELRHTFVSLLSAYGGCRWRRSRCWPGITRQPRRSWFTGIRSYLRSRVAPRLWIRSSINLTLSIQASAFFNLPFEATGVIGCH